MTPQDIAFLSDIGVTILQNLAWVLTISIFQGMFVLLFALSTFVLIRRGFSMTISWMMLLVTTTCFLVATLHWCAFVSAFVIIVRTTLVNASDSSLPDLRTLGDVKAQAANIIVVWTELLPLISDAVVVWRAWALFSGRRWIMAGPIAMLLATVSMTFAFLGYSVQFSAAGANSPESSSEYNLIANIYTSRLALSLATNVFATALIAWKLWTHRTMVVRNLGLSPRISKGQKVLLMLVESGMLYCALQVANLAVSLVTFSGEDAAGIYASQVLFSAYTEISAMYPTIVILLVTTQRSLVDTFGFTAVFNQGKDSSGSTPGNSSGLPKWHGNDKSAGGVEDRAATFGHLSFADTSTTRDEVIELSHQPGRTAVERSLVLSA